MPEVKKYKIEEPYLNLQGGLLEGPFWEKDSNTLRFVDIVKNKIHFVNLDEGPSSHREIQLDFNIGTTADIEGNDKEFIFGGKYGYGVMTRQTGEHRWLQKFWTEEENKDHSGGKAGLGGNRDNRMRSNDGAVDVGGRYWVGTMNDPSITDSRMTEEGMSCSCTKLQCSS
jgi:sugar lactone lactonase YvrE